MKTKTETVLTVMKVLFWIIFIGLCIKTGALLISFFVSLFVNSAGSRDLYQGFDLGNLYNYNLPYYIFMVSLIIVISAFKAYLAYLVIKISLKFDLVNPFSEEIASSISKISNVALQVGILTVAAAASADWLNKKGDFVNMDFGAGEFLFLAGIIFIIAQVFKKGIEIQSENDLTV